MQTSDALFRLIKSLTKNEKGYFRKIAAALAGSKDSNYMLLFDALEEQEVFDEEAILTKFKGEKFVKQLSVTKNYLFDLLLKTLRMYNSGNGSTALNDHLENAGILHSRLLNDEALTELQRASELAVNKNDKLKQLELDNQLRKLQFDIATSDWETKIKSTIQHDRQLLLQMQLELEITGIYYEFMHFVRHNRHLRTPEQEAFTESLLTHQALEADWRQFSFDGQVKYHMIYKMYYQLKNNYPQSLEYMRQIMDLYRSNPAVIESDPKRYLLALNNYLGVCYKLDLVNEVEDCLNGFDEKYIASSPGSKMFWFDISSGGWLYVYLWRGHTEKLRQLARDVEKQLPLYEKSMNAARLSVMKYNLMLIYHRVNEPGLALDKVNELLQQKGVELRKDLYASLRIYNLLLHYDLNNMLLLESAVRAAKNFLQTRDMYFELEKLVLKHFLKLINSADQQARSKVLQTMRAEVLELTENDPREKNLLQNVELLNWIDATSAGLSMHDHLELKSAINR